MDFKTKKQDEMKSFDTNRSFIEAKDEIAKKLGLDKDEFHIIMVAG